ncbi:MAG: aspartate/glutamate racemase family protein [Pseudaminobacter sp.]
MQPIQQAFSAGWSQAEIVNLLDDGLTIDRARESRLSEELTDRFVALGRYGHRIGADGILVTCSAFGPAIERLADLLPVPVVKPNESMFEAALRHGPRIGMLATFLPSIATMEEEFSEVARKSSLEARLTPLVAEGAIDSLRAGDVETHNRLVAECAPELEGMDAVMLAHFSTSVAASAVRARIKVPVLTAPDSAVAHMRRLVEGVGPTSAAGML